MEKKFDKTVFIAKFKEETNEHLARLEKDILYLEKNPKDKKLLEDMMREAHTLKGSATMMGYKRIAELSHKFEDAISQVEKGLIAPDDSHFELLFKVLDSIRPLLEDKLTWPEKGVAYPHVVNLEKKIDKAFGTVTAEAAKESKERKEIATAEIARPAVGIAEPAESIRVDVEKLTNLMNLVGELVVGKIRIDQRRTDLGNLLLKVEGLNFKLSQEKVVSLELAKGLKKDFDHLVEEFSRTADEVGFVTSRLQESVMGVRMLPLDVIFRTFPRAIRDLSKEQKKLIEFNVTGEETELDKTVVERIQDPLMHLLRNAVSHGIESPQERKKLGKPETGRIDLRAYCKGSQVVIEVEDDGRGINAKEVRKAAIKKGLLTEDKAKEMTDAQVFYLLFTPGLSTEIGISMISGRGVGLDVVRANVTQLKGMVDISSEFGKGTIFTVKLPLTLAVALALFVKVHDETFAIPLDNIEETLRIVPDEIKKVERREAISVRDEIIPLIRLGQVLGLRPNTNVHEFQSHYHESGKKFFPVVIVGVAEKKLAVLVDELVGKLEVVAKGLGDHLKKVPHIAGATVLGTGEAVLILDIPSLVLEASALPGLVRPLPVKEEKEEAKHSILVVEDSLITRDLEKSILEAAGYKVGLAKDGEEALRKLAEEKYNLVMADIAMPGMDGIEMIGRMKKDKRFMNIPVVVVSAKESDEDKRRGLEAGANAYIIKSQFDQTNLLDTIERLIG